MRRFAFAILCFLILLAGCIEKKTAIKETKKYDTPKYAFANFYSKENASFIANSPQYSLPLNISEISNREILDYFNLTEKQLEALEKNGFVVLPYKNFEDVANFYRMLRNAGIPLFITSDAILHLYHVQFNSLLKNIEERELYGDLINLSKALFEKAKEDYEKYDGLLKEASRRNVAFFAVALKLLGIDIDIETPSYVKEDVEKELANIENRTYAESSIFHYKEDYSQYKPRGHYTQSEKLKKYFMAMMWYGRMAFLLKGGEDAIVSEEDANIATLQATLISLELKEVKIDGINAFDLWQKIYAITSFFVGVADDLTPYEYAKCFIDVFGNSPIDTLLNEENMIKFKAELAQQRSPKIYGGTGNVAISPPITKEKLYEVLDATKGMRFIGQRYVPDSYIFQQLVFPAVGVYIGNNTPFTMENTMLGMLRCFPRGLDIFAVFGSSRAYEILKEEGDTDYVNYSQQLEKLRKEFSNLSIEDWNRNLYWSWLFALKSLTKEFRDGYPTFMQTKAWIDKELQTALASWTQLRHDTILYAKQSYTPFAVSMPPKVGGYVEAVPEFYARMKALVNMTKMGLKKFNAINETEEMRLQAMETMLKKLYEISLKELGGKLGQEDEYYISMFPEHIEEITAGIDEKSKSTVLVADVHTDTNTKQCLEEAVGYLDLILVAYKTKEIYIGAGATLSYYEFKQPMEQRLTDEEWKEILQNSPPQRPAWISSFFIPE